jgi:predicted nucleic acid-binding Zn ribbon protein
VAQATCDRCRAPLTPGANYCDSCGERTRKARRNVRLAVRVELLFIAMVVLLVIGFTLVYYGQK